MCLRNPAVVARHAGQRAGDHKPIRLSRVPPYQRRTDTLTRGCTLHPQRSRLAEYEPKRAGGCRAEDGVKHAEVVTGWLVQAERGWLRLAG